MQIPIQNSRTRRAFVPMLLGASLLILAFGVRVARAAIPPGSEIRQATAAGTGVQAESKTAGLSGAPARALGRAAAFDSSPDLQLAKAGPVAVLPGAVVRYQLVYTNAGELAAEGTVLTDSLPAGLQFLSAEPGPVSPELAESGTITWSLGRLEPAVGGQLIVTAAVNSVLEAGALLTNTAVIAAEASDTNPSDNVAQATAEVIRADLTLSKSGPQSALPGATITYVLSYANEGTAPAENVSLTDSLPSLLGGATVVRELGTLRPGDSGSLEISGTLLLSSPEGAVFTNTAWLSTSTPEISLGNNAASRGTTVRTSDLRIVKTGPVAIYPADRLTYTLSYSNAGSERATGVRVTDTLPAGVTFVQAAPAPTGGAGAMRYWDLPALEAGAGASIQVIAAVDVPLLPGTWLTNTTSIGAETFDPDLANNTGQAGTQVVAGPPYTLTVTTGVSQLEVGGKTTSLMATVYDAWGNLVQDGTLVTFSTPSGSRVTVSPTSRTTRAGVATATLTSANQSGAGTVVVSAVSISRTTTVAVVPAAPFDVLLTASYAQRTVGQTSTIFASVADWYGNQVADGTLVTFTTTLGSLNPTSAATAGGVATTVLTSTRTGTAVVTSQAGGVWDQIGVQFIAGPAANLSGEASPAAIPIEGGAARIRISVRDQFSNTVGNGTIVKFASTLGSVSPGQVATVGGVATATLTAGAQAGTAIVTATVGSLTTTVPVAIQGADIGLANTPSTSPYGSVYVPGQVVSFTLNYVNASAATARGVLITDVLPSELINVSWSAVPALTQISTSPLAWSVGNLGPGAGGTIVVQGQILPDWTGSLVASATASTTSSEQNRANNISDASLTVGLGDVAIVKHLETTGSSVLPGGILRYTINYYDYGPAAGVGVRITDTLPEFTSLEQDDRTFAPGLREPTTNGQEIVWVQDGAIPGNATLRVMLRVAPDAPGGYLVANTARIGMLTPQSSRTVGDDESTDAGIRVAGANVSLFQSGVTQVQPNRFVTYTITYFNTGIAPAEGVVLTDTLPEGVVFVSETSSPPVGPGSDQGQRRTWQLGTLPADPLRNSPRTIQIVGRLSGTVLAGMVLNNAVLATTTTPESHTADNTSTFATTVIADDPYSVAVAVANDRLPAGGATTKVQATVRDRYGNPSNPTNVTFLAANGTLSPTVASTQGGIATTTFASGPRVGAASITATVGALTSAVALQILPGPAYTLTVTPRPSRVVADGVATSTIAITVTDAYGNLVDPTRVDLAASTGSISPASVQTVGGFASATFTGSTSVGIVTITATAGSRIGIAQILLTGGVARTVTLNVLPRLLPADGSSSADLVVMAADANGNPVRDGAPVYFTSTLGIVSPSVASTLGGAATATIRGDTRAGRGTITARIDAVTATTGVDFSPGPPDVITLSADPPVLEADGIATATLRAAVTDRYQNPVIDGLPVNFTTTFGTVNPAVQVTRDGTGIARSVLTSAARTGTATVTATVRADGISLATSIQVPMSAGLPAHISLLANPAALVADGISTAALTITVTDSAWNPNHDIPLRLTARGGSVEPALVTTTVGYAHAVFRSGTLAGTAVVTVTTGLLTQSLAVPLLPGPPSGLTLTSNKATITVGADEAILRGQAVDLFGNTVGDGTSIDLSATLGQVTSPVTTTGGQFQAVLTAGTRSGMSHITARAGAARADLDVEIRADVPATCTVISGVDRLPADGAATTTISARVNDQYGNSVRDNTPVVFTASRGRVDPALALTHGGLAQVMYTSGTEAGRIMLTASAGTVNAVASIDLLPGPPDNLTLNAEPAALSVGSGQAVLRGQVTDHFDNLVADGTLISLTTTLGQVTSPVTVTNGQYQAILQAGVRAGTARVTAQSGAARVQLDVPIRPGPARSVGLSAVPPEVVADGVATATLTITATDEYANPLADGTPASLVTTAGSLSPGNPTFRSGYATSIFRGGVKPGTATITATVEGRVAVKALSLVPGAAFTVTVQVKPAELAVGQNATATVEIGVMDRNGNAVADGTPVAVNSSLGTLAMSGAVTRAGVVTGTLTAGTVAGRAVVRARAGEATGEAWVTFTPGPPVALDLSANPNRIPADGESQGHLVARLSDSLGNGAADGLGVTFETTGGTFAGGGTTYAATTKDGNAEADLRAPLTIGQATVTARSGSLAGSVVVEFVPAAPFTVTLIAAPSSLPADGRSTAVVTATVRDRQNRPVADGTPVVFEVNHGWLGATRTLTTVTASGIAVATLTAPAYPARARVRVTAGMKTAEAEVAFIGKVFLPEILRRRQIR